MGTHASLSVATLRFLHLSLLQSVQRGLLSCSITTVHTVTAKPWVPGAEGTP